MIEPNPQSPRGDQKREMRRVLLALGALSGLVFSACGPFMPGMSKLEDAAMAVYPLRSADVNLSSGIDAFRSVVYPLITQSQCTGCHISQTPTIAAPQIEVAYPAALTRLSKSNPAASTLVIKSQDGHCGGCSSAPQGAWIAAMESWAQAENAAPAPPSGGGGINMPPPVVVVDPGTPPVFLTPVQQMTGAGGNNRTISLAGAGPGLAGVNFRYDLQDPYAAVANSGRIFNPRIQNGSGNYILVKNIRIFQSADANIDPTSPDDFVPDLGVSFYDVDIIVAPGAEARVSFAEGLMSKSDGLYYAFGFQSLQVTNSPGCNALATFNATVNGMLTNRCTNCHTGNGSGVNRWRLAAAGSAERCSQAKIQSDLTTPIASNLIQYPFYRSNNHPNTGMNQAEVDAVINWITQER